MRLDSVHLAFVQYFAGRLSITTIERLWNYQVMPILAKTVQNSVQRIPNQFQVVEPTETPQSDKNMAKRKDVKVFRQGESPSVCEILNRGD